MTQMSYVCWPENSPEVTLNSVRESCHLLGGLVLPLGVYFTAPCSKTPCYATVSLGLFMPSERQESNSLIHWFPLTLRLPNCNGHGII